MKHLLELRNIHSGYGDLKVLEGVTVTVQPDEIVALIGPNGAGKSTVLKTVFGLTKVYSGSIWYRDKELSRLHTSDLVRLGISYVPQGRQVFPTMTVEENLEMGAFYQSDKDLLEKKKEEVYSKFPVLREKRKRMAFTLSGGQQQMLSMGRALMQDPQLLLLDEPSAGLSPKMMKEVFKKVSEINEEGTAIILVEQNAKQAINLADRTYVLEDGKVALEGGKDIVKHSMIKHIYLGGR